MKCGNYRCPTYLFLSWYLFLWWFYHDYSQPLPTLTDHLCAGKNWHNIKDLRVSTVKNLFKPEAWHLCACGLLLDSLNLCLDLATSHRKSLAHDDKASNCKSTCMVGNNNLASSLSCLARGLAGVDSFASEEACVTRPWRAQVGMARLNLPEPEVGPNGEDEKMKIGMKRKFGGWRWSLGGWNWSLGGRRWLGWKWRVGKHGGWWTGGGCRG